MKYKLPTKMNVMTTLFILLIPFGGIIWFGYDFYMQWKEQRKQKTI